MMYEYYIVYNFKTVDGKNQGLGRSVVKLDGPINQSECILDVERHVMNTEQIEGQSIQAMLIDFKLLRTYEGDA